MHIRFHALLPALFLALAASASTAAPAVAQDARTSPTARGWIGVSFEITSRGGEAVDAIRITEVRDDSPAATAGLRPGDRVVSINELHTPEQLAALPDLLRLRAGDPVEMMIERDGAWHRVRLRAAPRPQGFASGRRVEVSVQADSIVDTWARSMDSLRIRLRGEEGSSRVVVGRLESAPPNAPAPRVRPDGARGVQAPFEFFVFRGAAHDSLRHEMVEINARVAELEESIARRESELRRLRAEGRRPDDRELRRLESELEEANARSDALETAMAESARETAGIRYRIAGEAPSASVDARGSSEEFSPLTPYLMGRNRVAGAQVVDLNPDLARYFETTSGVLVVEVAPGTPAATSGLRPGDVITHVDRVAVRSVEDFRFGVSVAEESLPVTLVREGVSRQVLLSR